MNIIIGLGNPTKDYQHTRHNLGQDILKAYAQAVDQKFTHQAKTQSYLFNYRQNTFAYPDCYMNLSGYPVQKLLAFFKLNPQNLIVIHDDLDLPVGEWRYQFDRGPAGHNGIKSIIEQLGTQSFWRFRVGIGKPTNQIPIEDYVLQPFTPEEKLVIASVTDKIVTELKNLLGH
ncbi:MAG TPA: aminoacyl-tRNA hydrolase [Candidatus Woesebacteria bacterium]|nr:aminoacyl-tRNA hydrolase [Candidatus Woesebacteria bacterium]